MIILFTFDYSGIMMFSCWVVLTKKSFKIEYFWKTEFSFISLVRVTYSGDICKNALYVSLKSGKIKKLFLYFLQYLIYSLPLFKINILYFSA